MDALDSYSSSPLASLGIWNRACSLAVRSYSLIHDCEDAVFRERMTSASLSLAAHIAAGYERATLGQFANFLERARGNCAELRTQLYLAAQLDLIPVTRSTELMQESVEISRQLQSLITWCDAQPDASPRAHRAWRQVAE